MSCWKSCFPVKTGVEYKNAKTIEILGYTPYELKVHIEALFHNDMTWDNHGKVWEIDHVVPINWFVTNKHLFKDDEELCRAANSLTNIQPLFKEDNRTKGKSIK